MCAVYVCHVVSWWGPFAPKARVLDIAAVLHATRMPISTWYAKGGKDIVHPNPLGHALLGHLVARFVASGLWAGRDELANATMNATEPEGDAPLSAILDHEQEGNSTLPGEQHVGEAEQQPATAATAAAAAQEVCYSGDQLPLTNASHLRPLTGWSLVIDETGSTEMSKLGMSSDRVGDMLTLGPLPRFGARPCGLIMVKLGYLLAHSADRYFGAIELACRGGCHCVKVSSSIQTRFSPFPIVQTDASTHYDPNVRNMSPSVTLTTSFWAAWTTERPCLLHANHRQINYPQGGSPRVRERPSRVRIDSLALRPATLADATHLMGHPRDPQHVNLSLGVAKCAPETWVHDCEYPLAEAKDYSDRPRTHLGLQRQLCCLTKGRPLTC